MGIHNRQANRILLIVLCCLLPLGALVAALYLNTPLLPTTLLALALLVPLGYQLLQT